MKAEDKLQMRLEVLSGSDPNRMKEKDIVKHVDRIFIDADAFMSYEDIIILTQVMDWCIAKGLRAQAAKMKRNLGLYYFHNKQKDRAYQYLSEALEFYRKYKPGEALATILSDLGLVYFFDYQYGTAKELLEEAQHLSKRLKRIRYPMLFLIYYRLGFLYGYLKEYEVAHKMLKTAYSYARSPRDRGSTLLNFGVNYKRQQRYREAMACYEKAYGSYDPSQYVLRSAVLNNMAELHKARGEYDTAIKYMMKAFEYLECKDMMHFFICFQTYTEIKILQGESAGIISQLLELLQRVKDFYMYKCVFVDGLYVFKKVCSNDKKLLLSFEKELTELIHSAGEKSEAFRNELRICLDEVRLSLNVLSSD